MARLVISKVFLGLGGEEHPLSSYVSIITQFLAVVYNFRTKSEFISRTEERDDCGSQEEWPHFHQHSGDHHHACDASDDADDRIEDWVGAFAALPLALVSGVEVLAKEVHDQSSFIRYIDTTSFARLSVCRAFSGMPWMISSCASDIRLATTIAGPENLKVIESSMDSM